MAQKAFSSYSFVLTQLLWWRLVAMFFAKVSGCCESYGKLRKQQHRKRNCRLILSQSPRQRDESCPGELFPSGFRDGFHLFQTNLSDENQPYQPSNPHLSVLLKSLNFCFIEMEFSTSHSTTFRILWNTEASSSERIFGEKIARAGIKKFQWKANSALHKFILLILTFGKLHRPIYFVLFHSLWN